MKCKEKQRKCYRRNSFGKPGAAILQLSELSATFQCDDGQSQTPSLKFEQFRKNIFPLISNKTFNLHQRTISFLQCEICKIIFNFQFYTFIIFIIFYLGQQLICDWNVKNLIAYRLRRAKINDSGRDYNNNNIASSGPLST